MKERITLATLPQATAQEVFDQAVGGVIAQGKPAMSNNMGCVYRAGTLACVAGQLMSDDDVTTVGGPEAGSWRYLQNQNRLPSRAHFELIWAMQTGHDEAVDDQPRPVTDEQFIQRFKTAMTEVAQRFELNDHVVKQPIVDDTRPTHSDAP